MNLNQLFSIILQRQQTMPTDSYTSSLFKQGKDRIAQKVGEEAVEVVIAAQGQEKHRIIAEVTDLFFHTLVLLAAHNLTLDDIWQELDNRHQQNKANQSAATQVNTTK